MKIGLSNKASNKLPLYVAEQQGFFKQQGLNVTIIPFHGDARVLQALAGGAVDMNLAALSGVIAARQSGQDLKAFWAGYNMPSFSWYAQPRYDSLKQLKGGTFAVTQIGSLTDLMTRYALRKVGINPKDVTILQLGGPSQAVRALEAGRVDATFVAPPNNFILAAKGYHEVYNEAKDIGPDYPTEVFYAKASFLKHYPNTVKAVIRANAMAIRFIKAHPNQAAEITSKIYKFPLKDSKLLIQTFKSQWLANGHLPSQAAMNLFWKLVIEVKEAKAVMPTSQWLDGQFLKTSSQWLK